MKYILQNKPKGTSIWYNYLSTLTNKKDALKMAKRHNQLYYTHEHRIIDETGKEVTNEAQN